MQELDTIIRMTERWCHLGERTLDNGTRLIGHVPHVAPEAYFHLIFAPITMAHINELQAKIGRSLPQDIVDFLLRVNGISLFSGSIFINGWRKNYVRQGDDAWPPFDMATRNTFERPKDAEDSYVFVGGYRQDGSLLYIDKASGCVYRCTRESSEPLNRWDTFAEMLLPEAERLSHLFDSEGRKLDPAVRTVPSTG